MAETRLTKQRRAALEHAAYFLVSKRYQKAIHARLVLHECGVFPADYTAERLELLTWQVCKDAWGFDVADHMSNTGLDAAARCIRGTIRRADARIRRAITNGTPPLEAR